MKLARLVSCISAAAILALGSVSSISQAGTSDILKQECLKQLNLPDQACACIGKKAEDELSANEQAFVVAMVTKDQGAQARLRGQLTMPEMTKAGMFMAKAPQDCAKP